MNIKEWAETSGLIVGILVGIWKVGKWIYFKVIVKVKQFIYNHYEALRKINNIESELTYNGGKTTKDFLKANSKILDKLNEKLLLLINRQDFHFELAEAALFECNPCGECERANVALCKLFGATKEQMMGFGWSNFIEQSEPSKKKFIDALESDNEITDFYTIKNGNKKAGYTAMIKRDSEGKIKNIMGKVFLI